MNTPPRNVNPVVTTRHGQVQGRTLNGLHVYKGLPYAAPPAGANRLRPPRPVESWRGVRDAGSFGAKPLQAAYPPPYDTLLSEPDAVGDDCLNLNVWTPALEPSRHPVMVWIAGGAFEHGTGASYDGTTFARDGIVFVTLNYRVGAEGFLDLGDGNVNRGLLDQIAALRWVQENIAAFGGDPANVTLVGESAGAMSIGTLLTMPSAAGLFHRAILQSGAAQQVATAATGRRLTRLLADHLDVDATFDALATIPPEQFLAAQAALAADLASRPDPEHWGQDVVRARMLWQPVIDGQVLPAPPLERIATGAGADIDLIIGSNADEWRFFLVPNGLTDHITPDWLAAAIAGYGLPVDTALAAYRAAHPDARPGDLLAAVLGDWYIRVPTVRLADAHAANGAHTFMYEFAWRSPQFGNRLGACHALEIPFVFDALGPHSEPLLGSDPPQHLADTMHSAWVAFATNGDPGWPAYEPGHRATRRFATTTQTVYDPLHMERELWAGVR